MDQKQFCGRTRREFFWQTGGTFTGLALSGLLDDTYLSQQAVAADGHTPFKYENPMKPKQPHFAPKAKSVIFLFMYGGPSQMDTFDYKPEMYGRDNQTVKVQTFGRGGKRNQGRLIEPRWKFKQYGECGKYVSDLFPHVGSCVDDIAFLHSMTADSPIHGSAMLMMNSGRILSGHPCMGTWATYGLGSENQNLPGFVVMLDPKGGPISGAKNWTSGYMPASYQGVQLRPKGDPLLNLSTPKGMTDGMQHRIIKQLNEYNRAHADQRVSNTNLAARINSFELAYNMQKHAPEAVDIGKESEHVKELYGMDQDHTRDFGTKCLMARRLVERGVRFIQLYSGGGHNDDTWDAHTSMEKNHGKHAPATDKPVAGLLKDLKQRGLLDETLVIWGGEFGRQPTAEYAKGTGRDHNSYGFTMWMAGGGIKGGVSFGQTDELGSRAVENRLHVKHLHATVLHQMGLDPNRLSYFHNGLDETLVGVEGADPIKEIIA